MTGVTVLTADTKMCGRKGVFGLSVSVTVVTRSGHGRMGKSATLPGCRILVAAVAVVASNGEVCCRREGILKLTISVATVT